MHLPFPANKLVKLEDCEAYIVQIVGEIQKGENIVWTNHKILDLVLNMKFQEARKAQIKVRCKSDDMSGLELSAAEICSLFTNLLDNAIEASLKCPEGMERRMNVVCKRHGRNFLAHHEPPLNVFNMYIIFPCHWQ